MLVFSFYKYKQLNAENGWTARFKDLELSKMVNANGKTFSTKKGCETIFAGKLSGQNEICTVDVNSWIISTVSKIITDTKLCGENTVSEME